MRPIIAGNWKMNGLGDDSAALTRAIRHGLSRGDTAVVLCPPATQLATVAALLKGSGIDAGGQDCHAERAGAHTGDISAEMLRDAGARLRHSRPFRAAASLMARRASWSRPRWPQRSAPGSRRSSASGRPRPSAPAAGSKMWSAGSLPSACRRISKALSPMSRSGQSAAARPRRRATSPPCTPSSAQALVRQVFLWGRDAHPLWRLRQTRQCGRDPRHARGRRRTCRRGKPGRRGFSGHHPRRLTRPRAETVTNRAEAPRIGPTSARLSLL